MTHVTYVLQASQSLTRVVLTPYPHRRGKMGKWLETGEQRSEQQICRDSQSTSFSLQLQTFGRAVTLTKLLKNTINTNSAVC